MLRRSGLVHVILAAALCAAAPPSAAQVLLERHEAMGLDCAACHTDGPPFDEDPGDAACIACHGTMIDGPAPEGPDPHHSPHLAAGEAPDCTSCHRVHAPSEVTCVFCHRGFEFTLD